MLDRSVIAGLPPFEGLLPDDLDVVLAQARAVRYPRDTAIFEQGAPTASFFLLLDGHVRMMQVTPEGEQVTSRYINAGEMFGLGVAMGQDIYPTTAIAAVDCVVLIWPASVWPSLSQRLPSFATSVYHTIGNWLLETHSQMEQLVTAQVEQRVAHALLRLIRQAGLKTGKGIEIDFPISRQDIAEMTATTLHTVSRMLSAWKDRGLVETGRKRVIVRKMDHLIRLVRMR